MPVTLALQSLHLAAAPAAASSGTRVLVRASSHVLYLLSIAESTEPKQVYDVELDFVSERTIKDHHHKRSDLRI